jgi:hypothetical protein
MVLGKKYKFWEKNWDCIGAIATNARVWQKRVF